MAFLLALLCGAGIPSRGQVSGSSGGGKTALTAGIAKKEITPDVQVKNWVTGKPYESVHDPVHVRALVLGDGSSQAVIISWDLVDAGESATLEVRKRVSAELGIPAENIMVNATHNHSAPWSPVYEKGLRGKEFYPWWVERHMPPQNDDPYFKKWMSQLLNQTLEAVKEARRQAKPASIWLGRADISAYFQNRRPRSPEWGIADANNPQGFNFRHPEWDPDVLPAGARFGPMDRAMTVISFRDGQGNALACLYQLSGHSVAIYPYTDALSADWPGAVCDRIEDRLGAGSIFLQGAAGDINPARRGFEAVEQMAEGLAGRIEAAYKYSARLEPGKLRIAHTTVGLPLTPYARERLGIDAVNSEVQVIALGPLAIVALSGEPMTAIGETIKEQSPFPHTLVLGYSNGNGVHYVGMPGEKAFGGYEVGEQTNLGTESAGAMMAYTAIDLLKGLAP